MIGIILTPELVEAGWSADDTQGISKTNAENGRIAIISLKATASGIKLDVSGKIGTYPASRNHSTEINLSSALQSAERYLRMIITPSERSRHGE